MFVSSQIREFYIQELESRIKVLENEVSVLKRQVDSMCAIPEPPVEYEKFWQDLGREQE